MIFSKTELNFVERQAFASFKHGFFQVWGKCLPQSFPTPNGVTVLDIPAILLGLMFLYFAGRCYCHCCFTKFWLNVIAIYCLPNVGRCYCHLFVVYFKNHLFGCFWAIVITHAPSVTDVISLQVLFVTDV